MLFFCFFSLLLSFKSLMCERAKVATNLVLQFSIIAFTPFSCHATRFFLGLAPKVFEITDGDQVSLLFD